MLPTLSYSHVLTGTVTYLSLLHPIYTLDVPDCSDLPGIAESACEYDSVKAKVA